MFKNPDNYEFEFWYVIHNAAFFSDTVEKRQQFRNFIYLICQLFPQKRCDLNKLCGESASYFLYHVYPLYDDFLNNKDDLMQWVSEFEFYINQYNHKFEYSSQPKDFGPHFWFVIHTCATNCDSIDKRRIFVDMMKNLCKLIPCRKCSDHATQYIFNKNKPDNHCQKQIDLFKWTYDFHEYANDNTQKKKWERPDWKQVYQYYFSNFA